MSLPNCVASNSLSKIICLISLFFLNSFSYSLENNDWSSNSKLFHGLILLKAN